MPSIGELLPLLGAIAEGPVGEVVGGAIADGVSGVIADGASKVAGAVVNPVVNTAVQGINSVMPQQPAPTIDPKLSAMLQRNDLSKYPNIQRATQEPGGIALLHHMFGSLNGQPLHPEYNAPAAPAQQPTTYDPDQQDSTPA